MRFELQHEFYLFYLNIWLLMMCVPSLIFAAPKFYSHTERKCAACPAHPSSPRTPRRSPFNFIRSIYFINTPYFTKTQIAPSIPAIRPSCISNHFSIRLYTHIYIEAGSPIHPLACTHSFEVVFGCMQSAKCLIVRYPPQIASISPLSLFHGLG